MADWLTDWLTSNVNCKNPACCSLNPKELSISNACIAFHLAQPSPFDYREGAGMQNEYYTHPLDWAFGFKLMSQCQPQFQLLLAVLNWRDTAPWLTLVFAYTHTHTDILSSYSCQRMHVHSCIHAYKFSISGRWNHTDSVPAAEFGCKFLLIHTLSVSQQWRGLYTERAVWLLLGGNREQVVLVGSQNHLIWSTGRSQPATGSRRVYTELIWNWS